MRSLQDTRIRHPHTPDAGDAAEFRVIVTGSRTWTDEVLIRVALAAMLIAARAAGRRLVLVHGDCKEGADALAHKVARQLGIPEKDIERWPADWKASPRQAGFIRNAAMVAAGADVCLAFIDQCRQRRCAALKPHGTHGADHCRKLAEHARIPVRGFGFASAGN